MPRHSKKPDQPEAAETIRLADVLTFLHVYDEVHNTSENNLSTLLNKREKKLGPPSTVVGQLKRIGRYLFGTEEELGLLFSKEGGVLMPTEAANQVYRHFLILKDVYVRLKTEITGGLQQKLRTIRIGASQSIGLRLLSMVFSDWERSFGEQSPQPVAKLSVEIANSPELIMRLNSGLLDVVISYGVESVPPSRELTTDVVFRSLGYESRLVLLCHPAAPLWTLGNDINVNEEYWNVSYSEKVRPDYERLRSIELEKIDFAHTTLIMVPTWRQHDALRTFAETLPHEQVVEVLWYDEALALVRMGRGVTIAAEGFSKRQRITAFRLMPQKDFTRWIGVYYRCTEDLSPQACMLVTFVRQYLDEFGVNVRAGIPPAFGDPEYEDFCKRFDINQDWGALAKINYPSISAGKDSRP